MGHDLVPRVALVDSRAFVGVVVPEDRPSADIAEVQAVVTTRYWSSSSVGW